MDESFRVFISHFGGENKIAEEFQSYIERAFPALRKRVFRSSDAHSIPTGKGQYEAILHALETSEVFLVLLSSESARRPWVAFECGFGMAKKAEVFPLRVRGAGPGDVPSPFSDMLLRVVDESEVEKVLAAIEDKAQLRREPVSISDLLRAVAQAEAAIPNVVLRLEPYVERGETNPHLEFRLRYEGYRPLTLQKVVAGIPEEIKSRDWNQPQVPGHMQFGARSIGGTRYWFKEYSHCAAPPDFRLGSSHFKALCQTLYPGGNPVELPQLSFSLDRDIDLYKEEYIVRCWIETTEFKSEEQRIPMARLKVDSNSN